MSTDGTRDESSSPARQVVTHGEEETALFGRLIGGLARPGDVIALSGPLGAGKTCLVHGLAHGMGIVEPVPSPTFNLLLVHPADVTLYHFDLYRLEHASQLEDIDFYETLERGGVSVIEWADRFPEELPDERLDMVLTPEDESSRRIVLEPHGACAARLATAALDAWAHARSEGVQP